MTTTRKATVRSPQDLAALLALGSLALLTLILTLAAGCTHPTAPLTGLQCDPKTLTFSQPVRVPGAMRGTRLPSLIWLA